MADRAELQRWMIAAADGDRAAIEPLFAALWPIVVAYATRWVGDRALAEDCAQDALVKLFGQLARFDREHDALTWALTHATWQCRTARRRIARRAEQPADRAREAAFDGAAAAEERELVRAAIAALESLAPHDRDVIAAALVDDSALREAIAPATFRKRLERALARLRTSWRSRHGTL
ncbi:MAG TPA: sigma-70 family RNA polymerase sigma factor [Kofleriaceae bacterium]|nr:sigma-70 family RNA polymerase sigma factor [Kofleriaceae bacterium]